MKQTMASSSGALWAVDAASAASRHRYIGARKKVPETSGSGGSLSSREPAPGRGHRVLKRASGRLSPPELPRCVVQGAYRMSVSLRLW